MILTPVIGYKLPTRHVVDHHAQHTAIHPPVVITMASPSQPSKPQVNINKPTPTRSLFNRVMEVVILVSNVCGYGPLSFRLAALLAFASSYLMRGLGDSDLPRPIVSGLVLVGVYRLFVYNRFLDPLLGIPGPKV
jgi:hypothetical protein